MKKTSKLETYFFDCLVTLNVETTHYPNRVEEGHGHHVFSEDEEDITIHRVEIALGVDNNGEEINIDITSVLTDDIKNKILKNI
jgi:hypothetical protein